MRVDGRWRGLAKQLMRVGVLVLSIVGAIGLMRDPPEALADVEKNNPPQHFLSGDERAELVLRDILTVLKRMDQRLERLERVAGAKDDFGGESSNSSMRRGRK